MNTCNIFILQPSPWMYPSAVLARAAGLLFLVAAGQAQAVEFIDTFDTQVDTVSWKSLPTSSPVPPFAVESGKLVTSAELGPLRNVGLLSNAVYRFDADFTLEMDVAMQPLSPFHEANVTMSVVVENSSFLRGVLSLSAQLDTATSLASYRVAFGTTASFAATGDRTGDPVEDHWPLETNHLLMSWDASMGILSSGYDSRGGRNSLASVNLYDFGLTSSDEFRIQIAMSLSTASFNENRTATSVDNLVFRQVPEPSAALLGGLAGAALLTRRSRCRPLSIDRA